MPRWFVPAVTFAVGGLILGVIALLVLTSKKSEKPEGPSKPLIMRPTEEISDPTKPDPAFEDLVFPDFNLIDSSGQPTTASMLEGKITIVDFIFTNCPFVCPTMAISMSEMGDKLADTPVQFLSISVDPENDTPEVLAEYAKHIGADKRPWTFLTGDREEIYALVHDGIGFEVAIDDSVAIDKKDGGEMFNIRHPSTLVLVGPDRQVLSLHQYDYEADLDRLEVRVRALAKQMAGTP